MFKNKHIITALIVVPILAVMGYFAADYWVSERPHQAKSGGRYQLVQMPNCRYASGQCGLKNGNFKVTVTGSASEGVLVLQLESKFPLTEAFASVVSDPSDNVGPANMLPVSADNKHWKMEMQVIDPEQQYLRLVVAASGAVYYAETMMPFLKYKTSFDKDFRARD